MGSANRGCGGAATERFGDDDAVDFLPRLRDLLHGQPRAVHLDSREGINVTHELHRVRLPRRLVVGLIRIVGAGATGARDDIQHAVGRGIRRPVEGPVNLEVSLYRVGAGGPERAIGTRFREESERPCPLVVVHVSGKYHVDTAVFENGW